ncbi:MAG: SDR family NAD(P)-dependent oxidoreductase [bacterium]|nr:SDR family NAD(P)-dependent oxidoreductase [bacterium]MCP4965014.1 SDR family NAD(P)-dependent oxidoreductase [bacterium]
MQENVAVVTGGTGGLGRALIPYLIRRDFKVAVTYLIPDEARRLEEELDLDEDQLMLRRCDCTDMEAIESVMKEVAETLGGINVVAALVGGWAGGRDVSETDPLRFDRMIDLNLRSTFYTLRAALPHMLDADWGRVIAVGSRAARENPAGQAVFNASKAAVMSLVQSLATELDDTNLTANVLVPAVIDTRATRAALPYADYMHWPKPSDIAAVLDFLLSPASEVINGAAIPVYGKV